MQKYQECVDISKTAAELGREIFADFKIVARAFSRMGSAYAKLDDYVNAVTCMEKSLTEHRRYGFLSSLIYQHSLSPDTMEKLRQFEKLKKEAAIESYQDEALSDEARERGNTFFKANQYPDGVKEYTEAIKRNRKDPRNLSNRAACYMKLMALPEADKDCDDAIKIDPTFLKAYIRKAAIQFAKKDYKKTLEICNDVMERDVDKKHTAEIENQVWIFEECAIYSFRAR